PRMREIVSVAEPAGNGTTMRIGLDGKGCASIPEETRKKANAHNTLASIPSATHRTLLARNTQKPTARLRAEREPTSQAPATVATIAGHCRRSRMSTPWV